MASEVIKLNLIPSGEMPTFHCSQFDNGREILIDLFNGEDEYSLPAGYTAELHTRKMDNNIVTLATTSEGKNLSSFEILRSIIDFIFSDVSNFLLVITSFILRLLRYIFQEIVIYSIS